MVWDESGSGEGSLITYTSGDEEASVRDLRDILMKDIYISQSTHETFIKDRSHTKPFSYSLDDERVAYKRASIAVAIGASAASFAFQVFVFRTPLCIVCAPMCLAIFGKPMLDSRAHAGLGASSIGKHHRESAVCFSIGLKWRCISSFIRCLG